ncbi:MAG: GNAT family N-acetyltransferase [Candidatus Bathyarchaeota archaeon]|nr:GNAT family N-acetyltransferase [Candidatus Bathyarchaeota archaeon]
MPEVWAVTVNDFEELLKCYVEIWDNLREWLPDSFVDPELESIRKTESRERFKQRIESKDGIFLLAEEKNKIIGVALGREYGGVCNLGFLGIKKEHRRKGVGTNLLSRFVKEAKKRKAHKVSLHTSPSLLPAIKLYIKNGFVPEGFLRKHTRGLDMIVYSKFLE